MKIFFIALAISALLLGCAKMPEYRLGHFTAASTFNVKNMKYDASSAVNVIGEDCHKIGAQPNDSRLQRAMDKAIRNGKRNGGSGDLLVNVRIDQTQKNKRGFLGLPEAYNCIKVEADLVTLQ